MFNKETLFLVWGPPSHGPRSQVFAREFGISELHFIYATLKRGLLYAPFKYAYQAVQTVLLLLRKKPRIVFVQSPPSLAVLLVSLYCALTGSRYLIDAHSAAFLPFWTYPKWLHRLLARRAVTTIVTNEHFQQEINHWGGHAFVLRDIPTTFPRLESYPLNGSFNVVVINTFSPDEPLKEVLEAASGLDDFQFYVTGRDRDGSQELKAGAPGNVHFTGFLPNDQYYALLATSQVVLCLTTRDHTMQRGACEALWLGKPLITSDWPLLREYFHKGTVHVVNDCSDIQRGLLELKEHYQRYVAEIQDLQVARKQEWQQKAGALARLMQNTTP